MAAHLEDQLADVEQVVSADLQLRRSTTRGILDILDSTCTLSGGRGGGVSETHSQAETGDAKVKLG